MEAPIYQDLSGRTAIVTGAGSGIGRAIAVELARQNMYVLMLDISEEGLKQSLGLAQRVARTSDWVSCNRCDVTSEEQVKSAFDFVREKYTDIDVVVNNAGIAPKESYIIADVSSGLWDKIMGVNVKGYAFMTKYAEQMFRAQAEKSEDKRYESGSLVYICSNSGVLGSAGNIYGISNTARIGIMRQAALEMALYGVRANAVIPGDVLEGSQIWDEAYLAQRAKARGMSIEAARQYYKTRAPLGKEATAEQVAKMVIALASLTGPFENTTGQILRCDGGQVMM